MQIWLLVTSLRKVQKATNDKLTSLIDETSSGDPGNCVEEEEEGEEEEEPAEKVPKLAWTMSVDGGGGSGGGGWSKILYSTQGFPDNYTPPESFLAAIQRNKDLKVYSVADCFQVHGDVCPNTLAWP